MGVVQELTLYILKVVILAILGGYTGFLTHELTHYALGRIFGSPAEFVMVNRILPRAVNFPDYETMAAPHIRIAGGAVILWPILLLGAIGNIGMPSNHLEEFVLFFLTGASAVSPSDILGFIFPERWRGYADLDEKGHREALIMIIEGFRNL